MKFKKITHLFLAIAMTLTCSVTQKSYKQYIVIIDPAGDAKHTGRKIGDCFERGLTLQAAEKIKEIIEARSSNIKVIITRMPGDLVYDLQNASLSNRIGADLYINFAMYYCQEPKPMVYLYQFSYGNEFACGLQNLELHSYDQAYRFNKSNTDAILQLFYTQLSQLQWQSLFITIPPACLPIKPLIGIIAPSLVIEMGLKNKEAWNNYIEPLVSAIIVAIEELA